MATMKDLRVQTSKPKPRRRKSIIAFEMVRLDREAAEPIRHQLYRQIRDQLESGNFARSFRLPSTRALASDLGVSRMTVKFAFARLHAEGYLRTEKGSGTYVAEQLPKDFLAAPKPSLSAPTDRVAPRLAQRVHELHDERSPRQLDFGVAGPPNLTFLPGLNSVDEFPIEIWERLRARVLARKGVNLLRYASSRGEIDLRKALAAYLCDFRGARCHADQIVIVAGMQQAMLLCALALVNPGETTWLEDPGFPQARLVFSFVGARVVPRPVDREGIVLRGASKPAPKLIYVTPSHQYPMGVTMSLERRRALIEFGRKHDAYIFEDDYNSEFRFDGPPLPCLQGLDDTGRVIYAGTMSKILFPSARLGYLVAPEPLVDTLVKIRSVMDQHSPSIDQATLALFIAEGFFLSHVQRMRKVYADRRDYFIAQFQKLLGKHLELEVTPAGLHFVAWLRHAEDVPWFDRAREMTRAVPARLNRFCLAADLPPGLVFGFAGWSRAQIKEGLTKLAAAFEEIKAKST